MARTAITVQTIPAYGNPLEDISWTAADATNDHQFVNDGRSLLLIKNGHTSPITTTVVGVANIRTYNAAPSIDIATTNAKESIAGPFPTDAFNQAGGIVHIDLTADTNLELAVVSITPTP